MASQLHPGHGSPVSVVTAVSLPSSMSSPLLSPSFTDNQQQILHSLSTLRSDPSLCDVHFLVGKQPADRKRIVANSTVLALRSNYFKNLFFSKPKFAEQKIPGIREVIIEDAEADSFQRLLSFIDGGSHRAAEFANADFTSPKVAWEMRRLSTLFDVPQLRIKCDEYLKSQLTYRNGIEFLVQANAHGAEDFKQNAFRTMRNRGLAVVEATRAERIRQLDPKDLETLLEFFSYLKTDHLIRFIRVWGSEMDETEFKELFRHRFFTLLRWDQISYPCMKIVHELQLLDLERENKALLTLAAQRGGGGGDLPADPSLSKLSCGVKLKFHQKKLSLGSQPQLTVGFLLVSATRPDKRPKNKAGTLTAVNKVVALPNGGDRLWHQLIRRESVEEVVIDDASDVEVSLRYGDNANLVATGLSVRALTHSDAEFPLLEIKFDSLVLNRQQNTEVELRVLIDPALLADLGEGNIMARRSVKPPRDVTRDVPCTPKKIGCEIVGDVIPEKEMVSLQGGWCPFVASIGLKK